MAPKDPTPDPMALIAQALQTLAETQSQTAITPESLAAMLKAQGEAVSEGMRRAAHPQNAQHPGISAFNPQGDVVSPKAPFAKDIFFCGIKQDVEMLTPIEVEMFHRFTQNMTARNGRWTATVTPNAVHIAVPCATIDERMNIPSLALVLKELLDGQASVDPMALAQEVALLKAQLATA